MDGHRTAERRSLAYHQAIAARLHAEPELVARARDRVASWAATSSVHARWVEGWRQLLDGDPQLLAAALVRDDEAMIALRQVSPFAGALSARERWTIWRAAGAR